MIEIFLDLEGTPGASAGNIYLIGMVIRKPDSDNLRYVAFNEHDCGGRIGMFREFINVINSLDASSDYVIYHWGAYDRTNIDALFDLPHEIWKREGIMSRLVDLHVIITRQYALPLYDTKLKTIAAYVGFEWRQNDVDAMLSYSLYHDYVAKSGQSPDLLNKVLKYNEDDCLATVKILDWMINKPKKQVIGQASLDQ